MENPWDKDPDPFELEPMAPMAPAETVSPPEPAVQESSPPDASAEPSLSAFEPQSEQESEFAPELGTLEAAPEALLEPFPTEINSAPVPSPLEQVRQYADTLPEKKAQAEALFPFSLLIEGQLAPYEKARLLELVSQAQLGLSELELEVQFEAGRILIPRISEYVGVLMIQALRTAQATIQFGPSDSIYQAPEPLE